MIPSDAGMYPHLPHHKIKRGEGRRREAAKRNTWDRSALDGTQLLGWFITMASVSSSLLLRLWILVLALFVSGFNSKTVVGKFSLVAGVSFYFAGLFFMLRELGEAQEC